MERIWASFTSSEMLSQNILAIYFWDRMSLLYKYLRSLLEETQIDFISRYRGMADEKQTTWNPSENLECKFNLYRKTVVLGNTENSKFWWLDQAQSLKAYITEEY